MKRQKRIGVFETNSSSEHSISIVKKSNFKQWKAGKLYARRAPGKTDYNETWGNFWSEQYYWAFDMITKEEAEARNRKIFEENKKNALESTKQYLERTFDPEAKKWAEEELKYLESLDFERFREVDKLYGHMWITYEEYQEALHHDDCYSPFEHINETEDVVVFGKYFHS